MNVKKIVMRTMFISGGICGIAGMCQVAGTAYTLSDGVTGGVGFTAIIVAWLARLNPFVIVVVTALFSILEKGSSVMQSTFGLSSSVSQILQGIILFVVLAMDFFTRYTWLSVKGGEGSMNMFVNFIFAASRPGRPCSSAPTGEILTEKAGNLNLGR